MRIPRNRKGYTIVELLVTIAIVTILSATLGMFVSNLLTIQEQEREEAYFREKLTDVCSSFADFMSVASSFVTQDKFDSETGLTNQVMSVAYRQEAGGVSFETGVVSHVVCLHSSLNTTNKTIDLIVDWVPLFGATQHLYRAANGDASLLPLSGDIISCRLTPCAAWSETLEPALANLQLVARYKVKRRKFVSDYTPEIVKTACVERLVRLWNRP